MTNFPEDAVKDQLVTDLMASGYEVTRDELERKMGLERKQVWVNDVIIKKEYQEFSAEAQLFIKVNSPQWHIDSFTSIADKVRFALKQYGEKPSQQRWGSKAEIWMLTRQGKQEFSLNHMNTKKSTRAISLTAQVIKLTICGLKSGRRTVRVGMVNGDPHDVEI